MSRYSTWFASVAVVAVALAGALWWVGTLDRSRPGVSASGVPGVPAASAVAAPAPLQAPAAAISSENARSGAAVDVLHRWDRARSHAYAAGDVAGLRSLYVAGSTAGTTDARMLRAYERRALRVEGIRMQLLEVVVLAHARGRLRLRVTDRLSGATVVRSTRAPVDAGDEAVPQSDASDGASDGTSEQASAGASAGASLPLPRDEASTAVIALWLRDGTWKVASVR